MIAGCSTKWWVRLFGFFRNDQEHFYRGDLSVLTSWAELPLLQRTQQEFCFGEIVGEDQGESLEAA